MRMVTVAAVQMHCSRDVTDNLERAEQLVRQAAAQGANVILLPELFERQYFCQERQYDYYQYATPLLENPAVQRFQKVAAELQVVLPISFYERAEIILLIALRFWMQMVRCWAVIERHTFRTTIFIRRSFILRRAILVFGFGIHDMAALALESAGISGFRKQLAAWHCREQNCYSIRLQLVQNRCWAWIVPDIGSGVCRGMQQQI